MKTRMLLPMLLFATAGAAQAQQTVHTQPLTDYQGGAKTAQIQGDAAASPVTVNYGQPAALSNARDYQATVADLDKNGDGVITRDEVPESHALSSEFKLVDANHDGRITAAELAAWK